MAIFLQIVGAASAAIGATDIPIDQDKVNQGNNLMIAGLAFQIGSMALFGLLALGYLLRAWPHNRTHQLTRERDGLELEMSELDRGTYQVEGSQYENGHQIPKSPEAVDSRKNDISLRRKAIDLLQTPRFRAFLSAFTIAYTVTLIRCIYRLIAMVGGRGNPTADSQGMFIRLDSA